jgi:alpha-1,6-mannosyltransferase
MQAATPVSAARIPGRTPADTGAATGAQTPTSVARALGALGLLGIVATVFLVSAGAASAPSQYVPARSGGWPAWMAGPLRGLDIGLSSGDFQTLMLLMCASYLLVLAVARRLPLGALAGAIVLANAILLLGPPLISQDVFGYLAFARLGALHGLDPYTHFAAEAPTDPVFGFIGWPFQHSPYGPLFTLASYAIAPLGLAGGLWAFKAIAVVSSLGAVALIARAAGRLGHSPGWAAAFVGLNPVLLVLAVGGAHNDTLLILALALALVLTAGVGRSSGRGASVALAVGVGVKLTAGLALPFLVLASPVTRERMRVALSAGAALLAIALVGVLGFGVHALGFLGAVGEQQQLVATHSVPAETARLVGLSGTPSWWRHLYVAGFVAVLAFALWRTAAPRLTQPSGPGARRVGADWRVAAGWSTIALLISTAWLLPWYAIWVLPLAAVSGDRRLCAATLLLCAYAVLIHLPLADPLLSPVSHHVLVHVHVTVPGLRDRLKLAGFEVLHHVQLDLRW